MDSAVPLLFKSKISSFYACILCLYSSVCVRPGRKPRRQVFSSCSSNKTNTQWGNHNAKKSHCFQEPIQKPMLRTNDKNVKKEACEVFKYILFASICINYESMFMMKETIKIFTINYSGFICVTSCLPFSNKMTSLFCCSIIQNILGEGT